MFFVVGVIVWRYENTLRRLPSWLLITTLVVGAGGALHWNDLLGLHPSFASGLGMGALLLLALKVPLIAWRWPHLLGQWAYPIYLLHVPVLIAVFHRLPMQGLPALAVALTTLLLLSALLHYIVEAPSNRQGRSLTA